MRDFKELHDMIKDLATKPQLDEGNDGDAPSITVHGGHVVVIIGDVTNNGQVLICREGVKQRSPDAEKQPAR